MDPEIQATQAGTIALARVSAGVLGLHLARVCAQFLWAALLARQLGAAGYGSFSGLVSLGLVLGGLSGLGFGLRLYRDTVREPALFSLRWKEATRVLVLTAIPLGALFVLLCRPLFPQAGISTLVAVALAELLLTPFLQQVAHAYAAHRRVVAAAAVPIWVSAGRLVAVLVLPVLSPGGDLVTYGVLHCLCTAGVAVACWLACRASLGPDVSLGCAITTPNLGEGLSLSGIVLAGSALANADKVASLRWGGPELAGHYTAAQRFVSLVCLPVDALVAAALPRLFDAGARPARRSQLLGTLAALALGYGAVAGLVVWLSAPALVWLLGAEFDAAVPLVQSFVWLVPAYALRQVGTHALLGFGRVGWRVGCEAAAFGLLMVLIARWLPELGAEGVVKAVVAVEYVLVLAVWSGLVRAMR